MNFKWRVLVLLLLAGCTSNTAKAPLPPIEGSIHPTPLPIYASPGKCEDLSKATIPRSELIESHILYQGYDELGNGQLWLVSLPDGQRRQLKNYPSTPFGLGFLQDGRRFLLAEGNGVVLGDINGSAPKIINMTAELLENFQPYSPIWNALVDGSRADAADYRFGRFHSPDRKKTAAWRQGDKALRIIDQSSQDVIEVMPTAGQDEITGVWTPDSRTFIFTYTGGGSNEYSTQLFMVNSDGTRLEALTEKYYKFAFSDPILSPDRQKVVFSVLQGAADAIGIVWLATGKVDIYPLESPLGLSLQYNGNKVWSPDSQWIAFLTDSDQRDIQMIDVNSGKTYCITHDALNENLIDWH